MRLQDLNWMDVARYLENDHRIILITGATEQHAYLSLLTDILIPSRLADALAARHNVLVAPPFHFGVSDLFADFPGTISISQYAFDLVLTEVLDSLMHQGFRAFLILNGHGGNNQPAHLRDWALESEVRCIWYEWWRGGAARQFEEQHHLHIDHANWGENFPFVRVADSPAADKLPVNLTDADHSVSMRDLLGDGSFGGAYQIDDPRMMALFDAVVAEASDKLDALAH